MKLVRYGETGHEHPGMLDTNGRVRDLSGEVDDLEGDALLPASIERLRALDVNALPLVAGSPRLGPCIAGTGKFVCIGLNYRDHAAEAKLTVPSEPIVFMKATSAICGANDDIEMPKGATKMDWEVELAAVIGTPAKYVSEARALDHVAGYCIVNDLSERAFQMERQGQWTKGKSHDTFGPVGPWLVTADEVPDPQALSIWLSVNDKRYQDGSTSNMVFPVSYLVAYLSQFMTLQPGDIIATGTPAGVGLGLKPQVFLKAGDRLSLGIDGLGMQQQRIIAL